MNFLIIFKVAMRSLRRALLRSALTMLGIIIGVATVIAMVGIGNGAKQQMTSLLAGYDTNRLYLYARMPVDWRGRMYTPRLGEGLTVGDFNAIHERVKGITAMSLEVWGNLDQVFSNGRTSRPEIEGINVDGLAMQKREIVAGTFFSHQDEREVASVAVITASLAKDLYDDSDPIGRILRIKQMPFLVIGVMADDNAMAGRRSQRDLTVFVPYTDVLRRLDRTAEVQFGIRAETPDQLHDVQQDIGDLMEELRGRRKADFITSDISAIISSYVSGVETMTLLLASIAGISLLVGGIGIMNIMLVSVTERTREIGIRLAIGTLERDILRQFIFEAAILSIVGGVIGIGLGIGATEIMTRVYQWKTHLTAASILGAFLTSAGIGVFFGWYPAKKAARLDPIEALRYE